MYERLAGGAEPGPKPGDEVGKAWRADEHPRGLNGQFIRRYLFAGPSDSGRMAMPEPACTDEELARRRLDIEAMVAYGDVAEADRPQVARVLAALEHVPFTALREIRKTGAVMLLEPADSLASLPQFRNWTASELARIRFAAGCTSPVRGGPAIVLYRHAIDPARTALHELGHQYDAAIGLGRTLQRPPEVNVSDWPEHIADTFSEAALPGIARGANVVPHVLRDIQARFAK